MTRRMLTAVLAALLAVLAMRPGRRALDPRVRQQQQRGAQRLADQLV